LSLFANPSHQLEETSGLKLTMAIILIGMLDEREPALRFAKKEIMACGHDAILIDISIGNGAILPTVQANMDNRRIAAAGGASLEEFHTLLNTNRERVTTIMAEGLTKELSAAHRAGQVDGVLAVTGMTGAMICLPLLKKLPYGLPKVLITSVAAMPAYASKLARFFGSNDITVMHSVVDTVGLNTMVKRLLTNGVAAICGMAEARCDDVTSKPTIAITEFGFCDTGAQFIRDRLDLAFDVISFHATGVGELAALNFIRHGGFEAFIDLVPAGFSEYLLGGNRGLGPDRFDAGLESGRPYLLAPCGFDMIGCGPIERRDQKDPLWIKRDLSRRQLLIQDAMRVQARTNVEEMQTIARQTANHLNRANAPHLVKFFIPLLGFSSASIRGGALYNPDADRAFIATLKKLLNPSIEIIEVEDEINSPHFADAITNVLFKMLDDKRSSSQPPVTNECLSQ